MANMAERLCEKPVRKDLYNLARMVKWLPQYQDTNLETITDSIRQGQAHNIRLNTQRHCQLKCPLTLYRIQST